MGNKFTKRMLITRNQCYAERFITLVKAEKTAKAKKLLNTARKD